jgi:hypothetical protein
MVRKEAMICPECGAPSDEETTCATHYHACLVKEFSDAGYGAVHHLTVAAYMLQHSSKLSLQGWLETRRLLREFLVEKKPPAEIRRQNKSRADSGKRNWKIAAHDGLAKINRTHWTKTILDVRLENAGLYREDVNAWAGAALLDAEKIEIG